MKLKEEKKNQKESYYVLMEEREKWNEEENVTTHKFQWNN